MRKICTGLLAALIAILPAISHAAAAPNANWLERQFHDGRVAMQQHDFSRAHAIFAALWAIAPRLPQFERNLADALVAQNRPADAERHYRNLVEEGFGGTLIDDSYFKSLVRSRTSGALEAVVTEQSRAIGRASPAFELPGSRAIPESMAFDAGKNRFILGSTYLRKLVEYEPGTGFAEFGGDSHTRLLQALGVKIDASRQLLYVCTAADSLEMLDARKRDLGHSGVFIYDLRNDRLKQAIWLHQQGSHLFNDIALGNAGDAYITDSDEGSLYKLTPTHQLIRMTPKSTFIYPNGIVFDASRHLLYIADVRGIYTMDLASGTIAPIGTDGLISTAAIDGLYANGNELVAVQAGVKPIRIAAFRLASDGKQILAVRVLLENDGRLADPTGGTVANGRFYFIANSHPGASSTSPRDPPPMRSQVLSVAL